jgi:polyhydroxyalkanoate synthesis repressor PhaR
MLVIKRYPNRKLYDTAAKQYITLEGIAARIRDGEEVQIVDHATGEDLTTLTLTQIIFEQEKKQSGFLPRPVLTGLVQAGGETLSALRRTLASPLDMLRHVDEEIERRIQGLVKRGELAEEEAMRLRDKLLEPTRSKQVNEAQLERILEERGVPSTEEWKQLLQKLETLEGKLDQLTEPNE